MGKERGSMKKGNYHPWNKGLTKETSLLLRKIANKESKTKKGKTMEELGHDSKTCFCYICRAKRGEMRGKNSPIYGRIVSQETRKKQSKVRKNKTYKEIYGHKKAQELKSNLSKIFSGNKNPMKRPEVVAKFKGKNNSMYGKNHTEEAKQKISKANKGNTSRKGKKQPQTMGDLNPAKRIEVRKKISEALKGENAPHWIDGRSFLPYPSDFNNALKNKIKERDNYCCLVCSCLEEEHKQKYNQRLHAHHINYNKKDSRERNLVTTCIICNITANYDRDTWQEFFEERMRDIYG